MKKVITIFGMFLLVIAAVAAHGEEDFHKAEELISSGINCDELSDEQLELIGDYYMEQMHPGEDHEFMDAMLKGEGSASLRQMHINMARRLYCNESVGGMMSMMEVQYVNSPSGKGGNMMWQAGNMIGGNWFWGFGAFWGFAIMILFWAVVIWLIRGYAKPKESAIEVLKKRYAKGELTKKQFEKLKKELE